MQHGHDPPLPAFLQHRPGQVGQPVILDRVRQQPARRVRRGARIEGAQPEPLLQLGRVAAPVLLRGEAVAEGLGRRPDLLGDEGDSTAGGRSPARRGRSGWRR